MKNIFLILLLFVIPMGAIAEAPKGSLPEMSVKGVSEDEAEKRSLAAEILISKTEEKAIQTLQGILKKRKGTAEEPQLYFRLAELYMRRAKTGRFFDLNRDNAQALSFAPPALRELTAKKSVQQAIDIYLKIEREFPKYVGMDEVYFNNGFAHQVMQKKQDAERYYLRLVEKHPKSPLIPDTQLALGEMAYEAQKFQKALEHFEVVDQYPQSRAHSYALYKSAWALYNLKKNQAAINRLIQVVKLHDPRQVAAKTDSNGEQAPQNEVRINHNLRAESLRDLTLFFGDENKAEEAFGFFQKICTEEELGETILNLGKLYSSHSRQKEMLVFLNQFISERPKSAVVVPARLMLVDANETLKNRKDVILQFQELTKICEPKSSYRLALSNAVDQPCDMDVAKANLEMAKKWWEIWLKNRTHQEFGKLTRDIFELFVARDSDTKPDTKARFAFAELLFQQQDFRKASVQYEIAGTYSLDEKTRHDSNYSALVALEKASELKKEKDDEAQSLRLSEQYLNREPKGQWQEPVRFKVGFLYFQWNQFDKTELWLQPLSVKAQDYDLKQKSQDMLLEILNRRKDYSGIQKLARQFIEKTAKAQAKRVEQLQKLIEEADLASIQSEAQKMSPEVLARKTIDFYHRYPNSHLAQETLWQAVTLHYAAGLMLEGAEYAVKFADLYPKDERMVKGLQEAAVNTYQAGLFEKSARINLRLASLSTEKEKIPYLEAALELFRLEKSYTEVKKLIEQIGRSKKLENPWQLRIEMAEADKNWKGLIAAMEKENAEPYVSFLRLAELQNLYEQKKTKQAFELAKSILGSKTTEELKAQARLYHARIFEEELVSQGLKTSIDRLSVVLALKTEKLEKAKIAYSQVYQYSQKPEVQREAIQGLIRCYDHYNEAITSLQIKGELEANEEKVLREELRKLTAPVAQQRTEFAKKLEPLNKVALAEGTDGNAQISLREDESVAPTAVFPQFQDFTMALPKIESAVRWEDSSVSGTCQGFSEQNSIEERIRRANICASQKKWDNLKIYAEHWSQIELKSPWPIYYQALSAHFEKKYQKSMALIDLALKKDQNQKGFYYLSGLSALALHNSRMELKKESARETQQIFLASQDSGQGSLNLLKHAQLSFSKAKDAELNVSTFHRWHLAQDFAANDCKSVLRRSEKFSSQEIRKYRLSAVVAECLAASGKLDAALELVSSDNSVEALLQKARLLETRVRNFQKTAEVYQQITKANAFAASQSWIEKKIAYLKKMSSEKQVGSMSQEGVGK